jgi:hypothetical protein
VHVAFTTVGVSPVARSARYRKCACTPDSHPVVGNLENYPETGLEEIRRERNSAVPHFSQADLSLLIPACICSGVGYAGPRSFGPSGLSRTQASVFAGKIRQERQPSPG